MQKKNVWFALVLLMAGTLHVKAQNAPQDSTYSSAIPISKPLVIQASSVNSTGIFKNNMFHIYIDYFALYMPREIEDILTGRVFVLEITQGFLLAALASVTITALMIFLSVALPATINRFTNITVAMVYIPCIWLNLAGEAWMQREFGAVAEVVLLCTITLEA